MWNYDIETFPEDEQSVSVLNMIIKQPEMYEEELENYDKLSKDITTWFLTIIEMNKVYKSSPVKRTQSLADKSLEELKIIKE